MKKNIATTKEQYFCDICDDKCKKYDYKSHTCTECKRNICDKCRGDYTAEESYGNIERSWCKSCCKIVKPFKQALNRMWDRHFDEEGKLNEECHKACLKALDKTKCGVSWCSFCNSKNYEQS